MLNLRISAIFCKSYDIPRGGRGGTAHGGAAGRGGAGRGMARRAARRWVVGGGNNRPSCPLENRRPLSWTYFRRHEQTKSHLNRIREHDNRLTTGLSAGPRQLFVPGCWSLDRCLFVPAFVFHAPHVREFIRELPLRVRTFVWLRGGRLAVFSRTCLAWEGFKGIFAGALVPLINRSSNGRQTARCVIQSGLRRVSFDHASEELSRTVVFGALGCKMDGVLLGASSRRRPGRTHPPPAHPAPRRPVAPCPAPPAPPASPLCAAPSNLARGISGFWIQQVMMFLSRKCLA